MDSPHQRLERTGEKQIRNPPLLPPEVIYTIARQILQKSDLLSFGLVHSAFHDVVIPYYLKFREVIFGLGNIRMWEYLVGDPRRLATVEVLQIAPNFDRFSSHIGPQPPLPENAAYTEGDPLDTIQRALQGMTRLREVLWDENFGRPEYREERQIDMKECKQTFWAALPRLCKRVDTVTIITTSHLNDSSCWLCGPLFNELHQLQSLRAFTADFSPCKHNQSDLLAPHARTSQTSIVSAFSRLRELGLSGTQLQALPGMQFPSLVALSLAGDAFFDTSDGLLRMLEACPRLDSLHLELEDDATPLVSYEIEGGSLPSLDILPMLTSFTGKYDDARIIFFSPLPDGRLRRISRLRILGDSAEDLLPPLVSDFENSATRVGQDLLDLTLRTRSDRNHDEIERLLWVTWLRTIVNSCPKLRGLIFDIDDQSAGYEDYEETDCWRETLSPLKDLTVLKLPNAVWQCDVDDPIGSEDDVEGLVEEFMEYFPHLRLVFLTHDSALVIDPEGKHAVSLPEERELFYSDRAMERNWAFHGHLDWNDFDEEIERLLALEPYAAITHLFSRFF
ncbi:hypothetical protein FRC01_001457 [Tulasnella sp. 417]|nr:hypothetical protein FRC01_001457 [Tulasnella sp. 417]